MDSLFAPADNGSVPGYYSEIVGARVSSRIRGTRVDRCAAFVGSFFPRGQYPRNCKQLNVNANVSNLCSIKNKRDARGVTVADSCSEK